MECSDCGRFCEMIQSSIQLCCICLGRKREEKCTECSTVVIEPYPGDNYELDTPEEKEMLRKENV